MQVEMIPAVPAAPFPERDFWREHLERAASRLGLPSEEAGMDVDAAGRGRVANLWLPLQGAVGIPPLPAVAGGELVLRETRYVLRRGVLFTFGLISQGDLRQEELAQVLVDLWDEWAFGGEGVLFPPGVLQAFPSGWTLASPGEGGKKASRGKSHPFPADPPSRPVLAVVDWEGEAEHFSRCQALLRAYPLFRAYRQASRHLLARQDLRLARLEQETLGRKARETARLKAYYDARESEITAPLTKAVHGVAVAQVMAGLARSPLVRERYQRDLAARVREMEEIERQCRRSLDEVAKEARRRMGEVKAQYEFRVRITLVAAANVYLPYIKAEIGFLPKAGSDAAVCGAWTRTGHVPLFGTEQDWTDLTCEECGEPERAGVLLPGQGGELWCQECAEVCSGCGRAFPRREAIRCHICGREVCPECGQTCFLGQGVCQGCARQTCGVCEKLLEM